MRNFDNQSILIKMCRRLTNSQINPAFAKSSNNYENHTTLTFPILRYTTVARFPSERNTFMNYSWRTLSDGQRVFI